MTWIEIKHVSKQMSNFILGPIHLDIEPGTIAAFVGNNGSGKSTLLKMIMDFVHPTDGEIRILGVPVQGDDEGWKKYVAYQAQTQIGYDPFTGKDLKSLFAQTYIRWDDEIFYELIHLLEVNMDEKYSKLSPGEQQKLRIVLTIATNASILILDEPTSFMDISSKNIFIDYLIDWVEKGEKIVIISSHQVDEVRKLADYIAVMHQGNLIGYFDKEELTERYQQFWFSSQPPEAPIPGEVARGDLYIITNNTHITEAFLHRESIPYMKKNTLELAEIIAILIPKEKTN